MRTAKKPQSALSGSAAPITNAAFAPCPRVFQAVIADRGGGTPGMKTALETEVAERQARPFRMGARKDPHAYL